MKLKLDADGHVVLQDGKPVYVHDDAKEVAFDAPGTLQTISRLNGEAKGHRERAEAAEGKLKGFEGIDDPDAARKALETVKNIDDKKLVDAGKVEEVRAAAVKAYEDKLVEANKQHTEQMKVKDTELGKVTEALYAEKIGGSFNRSKLISDKFAIPADLAQAKFGTNFKVEEGKIVAYDQAGNKIYSKSRAGELADFDEALETLVEAYPYKNQILKGANHSGSGSRASGNGGGGNGAKTMTREEFEGLGPLQRQGAIAKGMKIVDAAA